MAPMRVTSAWTNCTALWTLTIQHVQAFKISLAKEDLPGNTLLITEITQKYHFGAVRYFCRLFRLLTGQCLREFRKNHPGDDDSYT